MTIEQICEFVTLAEQRNYLIAADIMFMTQATLSRHIMSLEEELGFSLFDRNTKRIELTNDGARFLAFARDVVRLKDSCDGALKRAKSKNEGTLRVGYHYLITLYGINGILTKFVSRNQNSKIEMFEDNAKNLVEAVENGYCDLALFQEDPFNRVHGVNFIRLYTDTLVCIVSQKNKKFANKKTINLLELRNEKFITSAPEQQPVSIMFEACRRAGFEPNIAKTGFIGESLYDWINTHPEYVALEWKKHATEQAGNKFVLIDVEPDLYFHSLLIYNKETLSTMAKQMIRYIEDECRKIKGGMNNEN